MQKLTLPLPTMMIMDKKNADKYGDLKHQLQRTLQITTTSLIRNSKKCISNGFHRLVLLEIGLFQLVRHTTLMGKTLILSQL